MSSHVGKRGTEAKEGHVLERLGGFIRPTSYFLSRKYEESEGLSTRKQQETDLAIATAWKGS